MIGRRILLTGGGTAGHVTPNLALIEAFQYRYWEVHYAGSYTGIEKTLITPVGIPYHRVLTGKLRRYFAWQNFVDPVLVLLGIVQGVWLCLRVKPDIVFSKGGFVAVPVVIAAWFCRVPVISHESDITPGLANRLCIPFVKLICVSFTHTVRFLPATKTRVTGSPVRQSLLVGSKARGLQFLGFHGSKPILLVFGGSMGSEVINACIRCDLARLLERFQVVHITGPDNKDHRQSHPDYFQIEYLHQEFGDVLAAADYVIARAGANSIYELLLARKRHLLIPLARGASRGDQMTNAQVFATEGTSLVIQEDELSLDTLLGGLQDLAENTSYAEALAAYEIKDGVSEVLNLIDSILCGDL